MSQGGDGLGVGLPGIELPPKVALLDESTHLSLVIGQGFLLALKAGAKIKGFPFQARGVAAGFLCLGLGGQGCFAELRRLPSGLAGLFGGDLRRLTLDGPPDGVLFGGKAQIPGGLAFGFGLGGQFRQPGIVGADRLVMRPAVALPPPQSQRRHGFGVPVLPRRECRLA